MGYIDIHSHVLPGLDDGAVDMQQALTMMQLAQEEGISDIIATPHYKRGRFRADSENVTEVLERLQEAADRNGIPVRLYPGTEIYYHSELEEKLETQSLHTMNDTSFVLLEFSPFEDYSYLRNAADDIMSMGYEAILAHVERYQCLLKDVDKVAELKNMGCGIQVNASSITGDYGFTAKHFTRKLMKQELIDYIGTDAHNTAKRKPAMEKCADILYKKCRSEYADAVLFGNARRDFLEAD